MPTDPDDDLRSLFQEQRRRDHAAAPRWSTARTRSAPIRPSTLPAAAMLRWAAAILLVAGLAAVASRWSDNSASRSAGRTDLSRQLPTLLDGQAVPLFPGLDLPSVARTVPVNAVRSPLAFQSPSDAFLTSDPFLEIP